jgi:dephospho-CoA kinase
MIIIGIVGQIASGKGILVRYLTEKLNFSSFSLSSIVHDELRKKKVKEFTRQTLQDAGDELRRQYGNDILAQKAIEQMKSEKFKMKNLIIDGIRNANEIEFFKKCPNFILIGVKAKRELRYRRLLSRGKEWDPKNYKDFLKVDGRDLGIGQGKYGQQVGKCLAYCDYVLTNNKDVKDFQEKIKKLLIHKLFPGQFIIK